MKRKILFILVLTVCIIAILFFILFGNNNNLYCRIFNPKPPEKKESGHKDSLTENANSYLRTRKDEAALAIYEEILIFDPENVDALWAKSEILRRRCHYEESAGILHNILSREPDHLPSLITLAYIKYHFGKLDESLKIINRVLGSCPLSNYDTALCYLMKGIISNKRYKKANFLSKLKSGMQIKSYFLTANKLAPDLPEVHLSLGTYYLVAPHFLGGNLDSAIEELELAVAIAPDFASASAKLAQAYKKKGLEDKSEVYRKRAESLGLCENYE
ncbi:MAG: hypothetical protein AB1481_04060 [Candidatus Omnitrophota bacterium]